jgi:hypothetical protein
MSLTLVCALVLQAAAVAAMRIVIGRGWALRPMGVFVLAATVYHGLSEILMAFPSVRQVSLSRFAVDQSDVDRAALALSVALLACVAGYLLRARRGRPPEASAEAIRALALAIDWRVCVAACLPLVIATANGNGYNSGHPLDFAQETLTTSLAAQFFTLLVVLASLGFTVRYGGRFFLPVLLTQSLVIATAGQRMEIFTCAATLTAVLIRLGIRPSRRAVTAVLSVVGLLLLGITSVRASSGRGFFYTDNGFVARVEGIAGGISSLPVNVVDLVAQAANRFDSNVFAGQVERGLQEGRPPMGPLAILQSFLVAVPSAIYHDKLTGSPLNLEARADQYFDTVPIDYVPGYLGLYLGPLGNSGLVLFMFVFGALYAILERWTLARVTPARAVLLVTLVLSAFFYERALDALLINLRGAAVVIAAVYLLGKWRLRRQRAQSAAPVVTEAATLSQVAS